MSIHRSMGSQQALSIVKSIGNGAARPAHKEASVALLDFFENVVFLRLLILLYVGTWSVMMLTVGPQAWTHSPTLSSYSKKCDARPKQLISPLTLQWLLT